MSLSSLSEALIGGAMSSSVTEPLMTPPGHAHSPAYSPAYSPAASNYSTYSHEVKYIFEPVQSGREEEGESTAVEEEEEEEEEYGDYSHIAPRSAHRHTGSSHNFISHTPRALSASSSQASGKENHVPYYNHLHNNSRLDESVFSDSALTPGSGGSVTSGGSTHGPLSPQPPPPRRHPTGAPGAPQRDRRFSHQGVDSSHHPYAKHGYPVVKQLSTGSVPGQYGNGDNHLLQEGIYRRTGPALASHNAHHNHHPNNQNSHNNSPHNNSHNNSNPAGHKANQHQTAPLPQHSPRAYQPIKSPQAPPEHPPPYSQLKLSPHHQSAPSERPLYAHNKSPQQAAPPQRPPLEHPPYPHPPRYSYQQHSRRKTWSPPTLKMTLLGPGCRGNHRACHSNDSLDWVPEIVEGEHRKAHSLSEDLDTTPPRLAPISGVLAQKPGPNLIKPIAYKPGSSPEMTRPVAVKLGTGMLGVRASPETGKVPTQRPAGAFNKASSSGSHNDSSQHSYQLNGHPYRNASSGLTHNMSAAHNMSASSSQHSAGEEFCQDFQRPGDRPDSVPSLNTSRVSQGGGEGVLQTPSPSDSGVGELEAMLREKDAEINTLRQVMDRNERAILQVYEERKNAWLHDSQELREDYERKMKVQSRKSYKTEQVLSLQVYKLQQEHKSVQEEKSTVVVERDGLREELEESRLEVSQLKDKLSASHSDSPRSGETGSSDSVREELSLKNKELITLKSQLQSHELAMERKTKELSEKVRELGAKSDFISQLQHEIQRLRDPPVLLEVGCQTHVPSEVATPENLKPSMVGEKDRAIQSLQAELLDIKSQLSSLKDEHGQEREQWLDEKNKVVRYQKQLQLNYVQMQRKNVTLETEVQQLTLELENRDMKLIALNGEESVC